MKNSSRHAAGLANPISALRFLAVATATAAKPRLDLGSARHTGYQNEFFNSLLVPGGKARTDNKENDDGRGWNRWRIAAWSTAALLLLLPLFAMQVTDQVVWDVTDFAIFGALLVGVGVTFELAARKTGNSAYRSAVGVALAAAFILIGVNGAVGIIGTENNDANLMFGGVLAVGIIGTIIARFQPRGMARAMFAAAFAQALVALIALIAGFGSEDPNWPLDILMSTVFFTALWLLSAWLFRKAAREPSRD